MIIDSYRRARRSGKMLLGLATVLGAAACVFLVAVLVGQGLGRAALWATLLGLPTGVAAALASLWAATTGAQKVRVPPELEVPDWVVDRPTEAAQVVDALLRRRAGTVGITTALQGAGGFGKTTLARVVCADQRVQRRFAGGVIVLTISRDVRGAAALAAKVNEVIKLVAGEDATFTDPELAGARLGAILDAGPRRLLVLDDVWEPGQLAPFVTGGRRCARLVTTRDPGLLAGRGVAVRVDQMSHQQALVLLTSGLPQLDTKLVSGLLGVTGRWPLLLRLVSKILANAAQAGADVSVTAAQLLHRLRTDGPAVVDDLSGEAGRDLDVGQPEERARAVRATIGASTSLLDRRDAQRFAELAVFAEDETIPFHLLARLWKVTGRLDGLQASQVCARLSELALVSGAETTPGGIGLHDVVRDFLRRDLGPARLAELNRLLVDAVADSLPNARPLHTAACDPARIAWWELDRNNSGYLWDHLVEHLLEAGRQDDAEEVASDLRWVGARLEESGPAAPSADLSKVGTPRAADLGAALARAAHLLGPAEPAGAVEDVLHSRVANDPYWGPQVSALRDARRRSRLVNCWQLPDLAGAALRRVLTGHTGAVWSVAVAPDGRWLVTGSADGTARIWDTATGQEEVTLPHGVEVKEVVVAPDGLWLASRAEDGVVRVWDTSTWQIRIILARSPGQVSAISVAPDGRWLATGSYGTVRIWDTATWQRRSTLTGFGYTGHVSAIAGAPGDRWLATGNYEGLAIIWIHGKPRAPLVGHRGSVNAVAVAPDGAWLATGSNDRTARIWGSGGRERATLAGHTGSVNAVAVAPDGAWLATASNDRTVRIWDSAAEKESAVLTSRRGAVSEVIASSDASWLVAVNANEKALRIWDRSTGKERAVITNQRFLAVVQNGRLATIDYDRSDVIRFWDTILGKERMHFGTPYPFTVRAMAPDGRWIAATDGREKVQIWNTNSHRKNVEIESRDAKFITAVAPSGNWIATSNGDNGTIRLWDIAAGRERAKFTGRRKTLIIAVSPQGDWLATSHGSEKIRIWDTFTGEQRARLNEAVRVIAIAPDGKWLATTGSNGQAARIWNTKTGQAQANLAGYANHLATISATPQILTGRHQNNPGTTVAIEGDWFATTDTSAGVVTIWDTLTGQRRAMLNGHYGTVRAVAASPGEHWLATAGDDRTIRIWSTATWKIETLMRVEDSIVSCTWLGASSIAAGGRAGLYLFDFLPDSVARAK